MALPVNLPDHTRLYVAELTDVTLSSTAYVTAGGRGRVIGIYTVLHGAIATTDAVLTPKVANVAMTMGGKSLASAAVAAGGTGYMVGDRIILAGGKGRPAIVQVATLTGSAVATVSVFDAGDYSEVPPDAVAQAYVTPAAGQTGATFNLTMNANTATITVTAASSAAGDIDSCTPQGSNWVEAGQTLEIASNGGPDDTPARLTAVFVVRETN